MKKILLLVAVAMTAVFQLPAQSLMLAPDAMFQKVSEDGHYFVSSDEGNLYILDAEKQEYTFFIADEAENTYYSVGFGHVYSNDNVLVGCINDANPGYLKDGEWFALPIKEADGEDGKSNSADAITPDGKRICGGIALDAMGIDAKSPMLVPVIWDKQADGNYGMYTVLPYPEKDFTGRVPQYITARDMSADGKTIVGQVVDYTGFSVYPIVYRQDEDGMWSYELPCMDKIYDSSIELPQYPVYEPQEPDAFPLLDDAAKKAYNDSLLAYNAAVDAFWDGLIDDYPTKPNIADFIPAENKAEYEALYAIYEAEHEAFCDSVEAFEVVYYAAVYESSFEINNIAMSGDGKYMSTTYQRADTELWEVFSEGYRINLSNEYTTQICTNALGLVTSIADDGTIFIAVPSDVNQYNRYTYVMQAGDTTAIPFEEYISAKNATAGSLLAEAMTFDVVQIDPETGDASDETVSKVLTGTASSNRNADVFFAWVYQMGEVPALTAMNFFLVSYAIDFNRTMSDGIQQVSDKNATVASMVVTDLNGVVVNRTGSLKGLNKGTYLVTATTTDGQTKTVKVTRR